MAAEIRNSSYLWPPGVLSGETREVKKSPGGYRVSVKMATGGEMRPESPGCHISSLVVPPG